MFDILISILLKTVPYYSCDLKLWHHFKNHPFKMVIFDSLSYNICMI